MKTDPDSKPGDTKEPKEEGPRSFGHFLASLSEGEAEAQLSFELWELGRRVMEQCKAQGRKVGGELKLSVKLVADTNNTVVVIYAIDKKMPKQLTTPALFWLTRGGNLSPTDTRQLELRPREVPGPRREPRDAPAPQEPREV